jgi:hypothetical protein
LASKDYRIYIYRYLQLQSLATAVATSGICWIDLTLDWPIYFLLLLPRRFYYYCDFVTFLFVLEFSTVIDAC